MGGIERLRLAAGKRLALVSLRTQALEDQRNRSAALFKRRLAGVDNENSPRTAGTRRNCLHERAFVRRGFVVKPLPSFPAVPSRTWRDQPERSLTPRFIRSPSGRDCGRSIGGRGIDDGDMGI